MENIDRKPSDSDIKKWSEGNEYLQKLLESARENNVPSMFCCAGHGKNQPAYITLQMNEETMGKIYSIMNSMTDKQNLAFRFAEKEFGVDPSFTIYMLNQKEQNSIMDIISEAMAREVSLENLPQNYQKLVQVSHLLTENDIGFDFEYKIGKNSNNLFFENLKFGNSEWIEKSDFKKMGLKSRRDMFGNSQYYRNGISKGAKEQKVLSTIVQNLNQIYDMDLENEYEEEISFSQKVAQKISSNVLLRKIPFINKFVQRQLNVLPEARRTISNK